MTKKKGKGKGKGWHGDSAGHARAARKGGGKGKKRGPGGGKGGRVNMPDWVTGGKKGLRKTSLLERQLGARKYQ